MRCASSCVLLFLFVASCAAADGPAVKVTVQQLLATPKKFVGKRVDVTGYYRSGLEESSLLADARAAKKPWSTDNCIWLEPDIWDPRYHPHGSANIADPNNVLGRMIRVIGTFHYRRVIPADLRTGRTAVLAYGHMGVWAHAITDIIYLRPLR